MTEKENIKKIFVYRERNIIWPVDPNIWGMGEREKGSEFLGEI